MPSDTSEFVLYCRGESGNCYKAALMLNLCGLAWEPRFVDFFNTDTKASFVTGVSDIGELPVLEGQGRRLSQSGVILTYLAEQTGKFGGNNDEERLEVLRWLLFDNHRFTPSYATLRMMIGLRGRQPDAVSEYLKGQAVNALQTVESRLANQPYIVGYKPTIADISMVAYQYFDEPTGIDRNEFPNLLAWVDRIARLPGWRHPYDLMPRALPSPDGRSIPRKSTWPSLDQ